MRAFIPAIAILTVAQGCSGQIWKKAEKILKETEVTQEEAGEGIKEALIQGISNGVAEVTKTDGYFLNPKIKVPFPPDAVKAEEKLRDMGMGKKVDEVVLTLNRAAEEAGKEAKPIFIEAIKSLTFSDALAIVKGADDEATRYLMRTTTEALTVKFRPVIEAALDKVNATRYWDDVIGIYNRIPLVEKINPDLAAFVTQKAIEGLFFMIAREEKLIRDDPMARTTDLLRKVFK